MNRSISSFRALLTASMKMFFRNRSAVVFTLLIPLALLAVFGFLSKSNGASIKIDVTNHSVTPIAENFVAGLKKVDIFKISEVTENQAAQDLGKGDTDLQVIVPADFGLLSPIDGQLRPSTLITHYNQAKPQNGQTADLILGQIITGLNAQISHSPQAITIQSSGVQTNNLGYFDFVLPGLLAMIIMQQGLFGVAFAFVSFKASGSLRRLQATPVRPRNFIVAQAITRLAITLIIVAILVGLGIYFFNFHMLGSWLDFAAVTILGCLIFLGFGFAIAGYSKDENQVAPLANVIQLPMLFLSGIFFPRDIFPGWLKTLTDYFPLTYLSDAFRHIANEGQHFTQFGTDIIGLAVWCLIVFMVAVWTFRWE